MKYSLKFYKTQLKGIGRQCGMNSFELMSIEHIRSWEEMLALIDFIKQAYQIPAYKIGPVAIRTTAELAEYCQHPDEWYAQTAETIYGKYDEWETL